MYNGWKNRQTWNVALWVNNEESLYLMAKEYVKHAKRPTWNGFICFAGLQDEKTPDGIKFLSTRISHRELTTMLKEMKEE